MASVLDWQRALENTDGDEELLLELVGVFLDECPEMMRQIRAALDESDAGALQLAAHSLKGSARVFAAQDATDAAFALESMGANADFSGAEEKWTLLGQEVERLKAELSQRSEQQSI